MHGADYVFHVAGLTRARTQEEYLAANANPTQALLEAALRVNGLRRFIYVSSLAAVGPNRSGEPVEETTEPRPADFYGISKLAGERIVLSFAGRLPITIVRPPAVYGPRDVNFLPLFRVAGKLGIIPAMGSTEKQIGLVHAQDLAEGIFLAASRAAGLGQTYFISSGNHRLGDIGAAIGLALGRRLHMLRIPEPIAILVGELGELKWKITGKPQIISRRKIADMLQPCWTCSWAKATRELGYQPRFSLNVGISKTAQWYREQGWM